MSTSWSLIFQKKFLLLLGAKLSEEELNAIIVYTHQRIEQLHKQLAEQQALEEKRIGLALERQREEDEQANREQVLRDLERKSTEWAILQERKVRSTGFVRTELLKKKKLLKMVG